MFFQHPHLLKARVWNHQLDPTFLEGWISFLVLGVDFHGFSKKLLQLALWSNPKDPDMSLDFGISPIFLWPGCFGMFRPSILRIVGKGRGILRAMIGCCSILWSPVDPYEPTNSFDDTSSHQMSKEIARAPEFVEIYWGPDVLQNLHSYIGIIINQYKATRIPIKQPVFHWKYPAGVRVLEVNYDQSRVTSLLLLDTIVRAVISVIDAGVGRCPFTRGWEFFWAHSAFEVQYHGSLPKWISAKFGLQKMEPVLRWFEYWSCCWKSLPAIRAQAWCGWIWKRRAWSLIPMAAKAQRDLCMENSLAWPVGTSRFDDLTVVARGVPIGTPLSIKLENRPPTILFVYGLGS